MRDDAGLRCGLCSPAEQRTARARTVTFSKTSQLMVIPRRHKICALSTWYTAHDKQRFRRELFREVRRMSNEMEDASASSAVDQGKLIHCIGIEEYVTKGLYKHLSKVRRAHADAVFAEQKLQKRRGVYDPERLSRASEARSRWTKERARMLAVGYSKLLKE